MMPSFAIVIVISQMQARGGLSSLWIFLMRITLEEYVRRHGPLWPDSFDDFLEIARQMAEGLQAAHTKGVLHLNVKPANVLVRKDESVWQVKLIDFGQPSLWREFRTRFEI